MKYPCELIQDLLPLYLDGVCSKESKTAIEKHLSECADCKAFYTAMCEADGIEINPNIAERERQKAASFQAVKKKLFRKQILSAIAAILLLVIIAAAVIGVLKNTSQIVAYDNNVSVSMVDGDLIGRLQGSQEHYLKIKRVTVLSDGKEEHYLFFYVSDTKWNELTTSEKVFSEFSICSADKGADQIDAVYYFTGDYTNVESMSAEELQEVIAASELLWDK